MAIYTFGNNEAPLSSGNDSIAVMETNVAYLYNNTAYNPPYTGKIQKISVYLYIAFGGGGIFRGVVWNSNLTVLAYTDQNTLLYDSYGDRTGWHDFEFSSPVDVDKNLSYHIGIIESSADIDIMVCWKNIGIQGAWEVNDNPPETMDGKNAYSNSFCIYATLEAGPGSVTKRRGILHENMKKFRGVGFGDVQKFRGL